MYAEGISARHWQSNHLLINRAKLTTQRRGDLLYETEHSQRGANAFARRRSYRVSEVRHSVYFQEGTSSPNR